MLKKLLWYWTVDRIGPDVPLTHFFLFSKRLGKWLCRKKFRMFGANSEVRPYAYAVNPSNISIGDNVVIRPGPVLAAEKGSIIIEDDVLMGGGIHLYVRNHQFDRTDTPILNQGPSPANDIRICKGAWVGAEAPSV